MQWIRLANGGGLSAKGAQSIGVHLLSKAAAACGESYGLKLPPYIGASSLSVRVSCLSYFIVTVPAVCRLNEYRR